MARGIWTAGSGGADLDELGSAGATPAHVLSGRTFYGAGSEAVQIGTIPMVGGFTHVPGTANKTAIYAGQYASANINISGDPNLVPANIKKNVTIFGVKGTAEGYFPTPTDLYYKGQNPYGFYASTTGTATFGALYITFNNANTTILSNTAKNLTTYSKVNVLFDGRAGYREGYSFPEFSIRIYNRGADATSNNRVAESILRPTSGGSNTWTNATLSVDCSNLAGNYYIRVATHEYMYGTFNDVKIHRVWLS